MRAFLPPDGDTCVEHMRILVSGPDAQTTGARARALVSAADLSPPGMLPQAILIVRRFGRELPALVASRDRVLPPRDWQQAVSDQLGRLASRATAPSRGSVENDSDAICFNDRAEMLACLGLDWVNGVAASRWWWQTLLRNAPIEQRIPEIWRGAPEYVPAAMERLAAKAAAVPFVQKHSAEQVKRLLAAILHVFSLRALETAIPAEFSRPRRPEPKAPWASWAPEAGSSPLTLAEPERRLLIAICLMLRRAPDVVRKRSFAARVEAWSRSAAVAAPTVTPAEPIINSALSSSSPDLSPSVEHVPKNLPAEPAHLEPPIERLAVDHTESIQHEPLLISIDREHPERPNVPEFAAEADVVEEPTDTQFFSREFIEIQTAFGGVFYLINLGIFLGFYGDFTTPLEPGIELSIWDFIALTGRALAGKEIEDDAVWPLLADLAGRHRDEEPGAGYEHWLSEQMPAMSERLLLALGLDGPAHLPEVLLRNEGRVQVTATHLDVFFSLDDHPIEIRLSGLDRDPGWAPAAGRYIAFHFD